MKTLRVVLSAVSVILLLAGYLASQYTALNGTASDYASKVDQPPVRLLALLLLVAAVVLAFIPEREET
jgi:succinate dehydrogenase hydrophobic anchor subunit